MKNHPQIKRLNSDNFFKKLGKKLTKKVIRISKGKAHNIVFLEIIPTSKFDIFHISKSSKFF